MIFKAARKGKSKNFWHISYNDKITHFIIIENLKSQIFLTSENIHEMYM